MEFVVSLLAIKLYRFLDCSIGNIQIQIKIEIKHGKNNWN